MRKKASGAESTAAVRTKVFVWGLNDKDQLGGLKGSKIKVPSFSETLSALNVVQVAGGPKVSLQLLLKVKSMPVEKPQMGASDLEYLVEQYQFLDRYRPLATTL